MINYLKFCLKNISPVINRVQYQSFASKRINQLAEEFNERIQREQLVPNIAEEYILKNYLQLTENSYMDHLLEKKRIIQEQRGRIDPRLILMILPTLQQPHVIKQHILMLYQHLSILESKQLLLFYEYLLAYKITPPPKLPSPRNINNAESILVLLGQLYPKEQLLEWMGQVPLYNGNNLYLLAMGTFSILANLPKHVQQKNEKLIYRSLERIKQLWSGQDSDSRVSVIILALQSKLPIAEQLLLQKYSLDFLQIDGLKMGLLLVELDSYIKNNYSHITGTGPKIRLDQEDLTDIDIDQGVNKPRKKNNKKKYVYNPNDFSETKYRLQIYLISVAKHLRLQNWKGIVKLHQIVRFYQVIKNKKIEGEWQKFAVKLFNFTTLKEQATSLINLSTKNVIDIIQIVEQLKINKPELIKQLLVVLADRLEIASADELVKLSRCIVTYVRLCEDYLLNFRVIIERRKYIFSLQQINTLNFNFRRVQVLFPKQLSYD